MGVEQRSKRSYDQIDANIETGESSHHPPERSHHQNDHEVESDESLQQPTARSRDQPTNAETEPCRSSPRAIYESRDQAGIETEVGESSKRPCFDGTRLLDRGDFNYMQRNDPPYRASPISSMQEPTSSNCASGISTSKPPHLPRLHYDRKRPLNRKNFLPKQRDHPPSKQSSPSHPTSSHFPNAPNTAPPPRPTFNQLATDGQQGMKALFLINHATKGDAINHHIRAFVPSPSSTEMRLLMSKYRSDRSTFQNRFFAKARPICAQLTSRREFLETEGAESNRARRLEYFGEKCSDIHLSTLYSQIGSAVDVAKILAARTRNEKAFKKLMTQVFIHSMEDLWWFELHPGKQGVSAKVEKEDKEEVYGRFKDLTDRFNGLPAARDLPGYLEVPLKADFPRYVLFGHDTRPRNEEDVFESDEEGGDGDEGGDVLHPWIPAEVCSRDNGFPPGAY